MAARDQAGPILNGLPSQLPDIDPDETQEWLDSLDGAIEEGGRTRARYLMLKLIQRAREKQLGVPSLTATDYINTIPPEREPWFPGDEEVERRYRAWLRWNAAVMVHRAQRPDISVGGHISTYASAATLYEVGFNHFFRGKDHPGGGDQIFFQGHASPGMYARAFLEGRLTEAQLDGFRQEKSHLVDGKPLALPSYPHPRLMPDFWEFPTVSMGLGPDERDLPGAVQQVPPEPRHQGHQPAARLGVPRRRRDGRARVARPAAAGRRRGARQPHLRHQLQPAAARRPGARQRQDHPGAGVVLPRRRLERHQGRLGPRLGPAAGPGPGRRARQHHEPDERRRLPDLPRQRRRLRPRALLRPRPAHPRDGQGLERRGRLVEAQARRPRLPQGVCRLQGRDGAHRPADGHPREDHQGLRPRQPLRRSQRHAPDEEAHARRPQGPARQPQAADQRRAARGRPVPPAVLPPGRGRPDDPVRQGAAPEARRLPAVATGRPQAARACRRTSPTRS